MNINDLSGVKKSKENVGIMPRRIYCICKRGEGRLEILKKAATGHVPELQTDIMSLAWVKASFPCIDFHSVQ